MFTGIIEELGEVTAWEPTGDAARLTVRAPLAASDAHARRLDLGQRRLPHGRRPGRRLVHGGCHGRVDRGQHGRPAPPATASTSSARHPSETASAATSCRATSTAPRRSSPSRTARPGAWCASPSPAELAALVTRKGSIAIDGISLTVSAVSDADEPQQWFEVSLIPETLDRHHPRRARAPATPSTSRPTSWPGTSSACSPSSSRSTRRRQRMSLADIPTALQALREGKPVIVADDEGRENEGDVIIAAESASQEWVAWMVKHTSGFICAPMTNEIADRLDLPPDGRAQRGPARHRVHGRRGCRRPASARASAPPTAPTPCGCSPTPRRRRRASPAPATSCPLRAVDGGVRERDGHTEATVDLLKLAGLTPVGRDRRDRRRRRRDDAPARADRARRARRRAGHHDRVAHPLHGGEPLRGRPEGGRRGPRVGRASPSRSRPTCRPSTACSACGRTATARPAPTTSRGSRRADRRHPGARALRVPDRRGVRLAQVRVRPAAAGGARHHRGGGRHRRSTCAATRAAASG